MANGVYVKFLTWYEGNRFKSQSGKVLQRIFVPDNDLNSNKGYKRSFVVEAHKVKPDIHNPKYDYIHFDKDVEITLSRAVDNESTGERSYETEKILVSQVRQLYIDAIKQYKESLKESGQEKNENHKDEVSDILMDDDLSKEIEDAETDLDYLDEEENDLVK